jgi:hypothetical protein
VFAFKALLKWLSIEASLEVIDRVLGSIMKSLSVDAFAGFSNSSFYVFSVLKLTSLNNTFDNRPEVFKFFHVPL